jgi:hypothetical protein
MVSKVTPTGFSIKALSAIIRAQDPNIDASDAKEIAQTIKMSIMTSLFGEAGKSATTKTTTTKSKTASDKTADTKAQTKKINSIESELKEVKKSINKNEKSISQVQKTADKTQNDVGRILKQISNVSDRVKSSSIKSKERMYDVQQVVSKTAMNNEPDYATRIPEAGILLEISNLKNQIQEIKKSKDFKLMEEGETGNLDIEQIEALQAERHYEMVDFEKGIDGKLDQILDLLQHDGGKGGLLNRVEEIAEAIGALGLSGFGIKKLLGRGGGKAAVAAEEALAARAMGAGGRFSRMAVFGTGAAAIQSTFFKEAGMIGRGGIGAFGEQTMSAAQRSQQAFEKFAEAKAAKDAAFTAQRGLPRGEETFKKLKAQEKMHGNIASEQHKIYREARSEMYESLSNVEKQALQKNNITFNPETGSFHKVDANGNIGEEIKDQNVNRFFEEQGLRGNIQEAQIKQLRRAGIVEKNGMYYDKVSKTYISEQEALNIVRDPELLNSIKSSKGLLARKYLSQGAGQALKGALGKAGKFAGYGAFFEAASYFVEGKEVNAENLKKSAVSLAGSAGGAVAGGAIGAGIGAIVGGALAPFSAGLSLAAIPAFEFAGELIGSYVGEGALSSLWDRVSGNGPGSDQVEKILATIRMKESRNNYTAFNTESTASGAYQFLDSSWKFLTKKYGIGEKYARAKDAPSDIQDQVARRYVQDILKQSGGDVRAVPLAWYTGNIQGNISAAALAANHGMLPETYANSWMDTYNRAGGTSVSPQSIPTDISAKPTEGQMAAREVSSSSRSDKDISRVYDEYFKSQPAAKTAQVQPQAAPVVINQQTAAKGGQQQAANIEPSAHNNDFWIKVINAGYQDNPGAAAAILGMNA